LTRICDLATAGKSLHAGNAAYAFVIIAAACCGVRSFWILGTVARPIAAANINFLLDYPEKPA
jgi:hypothetical protein